MSLPKFTYLAPRNLKEASAWLTEHGDKARVMAGGTDLLIRLRHRAMTPDYVIGLSGLTGLDHIRFDPATGLTIGALTHLATVADHPEVRRHYPALAESAGVTATVQIRHKGTLVGNLCNAAPSADNAPPLLVHEADIVIVHPGGERLIALAEFFRGPGLTALEKGELVKEVRVPLPGPATGSNYQKISARSRVDIAAVGVAALIKVDEAGVCLKARVALGAVAPIPMRARRTEKILEGQKLSSELLLQAGETAAGECSPITDVRATAQYRRRMVAVLTERSLATAWDSATKSAAGCQL